MFWDSFFDKYWSFNNTKFVKLLNMARKKSLMNKNNSNLFESKTSISLFNSVSKKDLWKFINKLSIFINSWIDIKWALWILVKQTKNPKLKSVVLEIKNNIDHWITIKESMSNYPKIFDTLTVALVWVWEKTWQLWKILRQLDVNLLENIELRSRVKWAMIYPVVLLFLTISMVIFMMIFIVPKITAVFLKSWTELPKLTQIIVSVSDFLKNDYLILIWIIIWIIVLFKFLNSTYFWRVMFANIYINLPIFWFVFRQSNIIYFIKSFTILLDSWVLLLDSLKSSSQVVPNLAYKKELVKIKNEVEVWLTISKSLWLNMDYESSIYLNKLFPEDFAYVVNVWEETWSLSDSLKKIWENYSSELKRYIWNLSSMMEPIIIVIVWFLVWTIVIGIMLPFFEMWKIAKKL